MNKLNILHILILCYIISFFVGCGAVATVTEIPSSTSIEVTTSNAVQEVTPNEAIEVVPLYNTIDSTDMHEVIFTYLDNAYTAYASLAYTDMADFFNTDTDLNKNMLVGLEMLIQRRALISQFDFAYVDTTKHLYKITFEADAEDAPDDFWEERYTDPDISVVHFRITGDDSVAYPPFFALNSQHTMVMRNTDDGWVIETHYYPGMTRTFFVESNMEIQSAQDMYDNLMDEFRIDRTEHAEIPSNVQLYDGQAAADYAQEYISTGNNEYYTIPDWQGNCQNFVSQALYAGFSYDGYEAMNNSWFAGSGGGSPAWENVNHFWEYAVEENGLGGTEIQAVRGLEVGDVIQVRSQQSDEPDKYSHIYMLVDKEQMLLAQNTPASLVSYADLWNFDMRLFSPEYSD